MLWWRRKTLRARLVLLALACVLPVVCLGGIREYLDYRAERQRTYDGLQAMAESMALSVERELQIHLRSLETLALSKMVESNDLDGFASQAQRFLASLPDESSLAIIDTDLHVRRIWGATQLEALQAALQSHAIPPFEVFQTRRSTVTNLRNSKISGRLGFSIEVPVMRGDQVLYDLIVFMPATVMESLFAHRFLPPGSVLTVIDTAGIIAARIPNGARYAGHPIMPELWSAIRQQDSGIMRVPTLEGIPAVAAFTHVKPFNWAVIAGAPEEVLFSGLRGALLRLAEGLALVVVTALTFGTLAARGITRPIERLQRLAVHDDRIVPETSAITGLAEVDVAAQALVDAAAERRKVVDALAESERRFRALFEQSGSGTILVDPETLRIVDCNESAAAFLDYTIAEFKGRLITDFALRTSSEEIQAMGRAALQGKNWRYEATVLGRNGPRNLLNAVAPVQVAGRTMMLVNQIDVTGLRRAEAGLRANEERLELARQGASLGIWDWNVATDTLSWSEHQWFLHGLSPQSGNPTPELWRQTIHPGDLARVVDELRVALRQHGCPFATEYSVLLADGSIRRLLARGQSVRDESGRVVRMVGINMDVTARYEAEMARDRLIWMLETERSRLSEIIEAVPIGVGLVNHSGMVVLGNARMHALIGNVIPSMAETSPGDWIAYDEDGGRIPLDRYPIRRALTNADTTLPGQDFLFRDQHGRETWIRVGALPLRRENGVVVEALAILQDVDAEKRLLDIQQQINARLEQRVREEVTAREAAQQRAAHAERMHALGQLAGGIAHDFNNVLQAVSGGAALIERRPGDVDRVLRNARMVIDASRRGAAITSRLLAFARRGDLRAESIDAAALLGDMAEILTHTLGGSIICRTEAAPNLPPLFADRGQLETVLVNLATNARDAMPLGGILTLAAEAEAVIPSVPHPAGLIPGNYIRLTVTDTGCGMDQAVLARVTEPFYTTKEPGKGTGLGLAMAKGFVEQSGGSLSIDSTVGRGTRVILWLPGSSAQSGIGSQVPDAQPTADDRASVLLVDDDPMVRHVLKLSLEDAGYLVRAMENGPATLAWLSDNEHVDVLVSDLSMPGMDGVELIRSVQERRPGLPAVLLTGYAGDGAALAVGGAITGAFSLLRKPISGHQLADRINALLEGRRRRVR